MMSCLIQRKKGGAECKEGLVKQIKSHYITIDSYMTRPFFLYDSYTTYPGGLHF